MGPENRYFELRPKIVLADTEATISIRALHVRFKEEAEYEINYYPLERYSQTGEYKYQEIQKVKPENGVIIFKQFFKGEQEHVLRLKETLGEKSRLYEFRIYSLEKDLFDRKPYKGDLHMHSYYSDGRESPGFIAASCRRIGMDFMAITDHNNYQPSIEAQDVFEDVEHDLLICRGEEIHPPGNPVHMVNFGGNFSVYDLIKNDKDKYFNEVKEIENTIKNVSDPDAIYQCASCIWCFNKIREGNGLGIFCHPYWQINTGYYISDSVITYMYEHQPYDANEVIGGYNKPDVDSNTLQVARYNEERAKGRKIPIVGVSDAHSSREGVYSFGWHYTIVFSSKNEKDDLINSIKNLYSVAVEAIEGEPKRAYGPFRLVKYAQFLFREVFPLHDELCFLEGEFMRLYIEGYEEAANILKKLKGQTARLYDAFYGTPEYEFRYFNVKLNLLL
ncbi:MAG TPA: hypothetical protein GXX20_08150 [Clostridiaceae bacterium]|nr:hypothetical protein [Clostridiaceae bacterium]